MRWPEGQSTSALETFPFGPNPLQTGGGGSWPLGTVQLIVTLAPSSQLIPSFPTLGGLCTSFCVGTKRLMLATEGLLLTCMQTEQGPAALSA